MKRFAILVCALVLLGGFAARAQFSYAVFQWGAMGDVAVPSDYNGDGQTDLGIFRPATGEWWVRFSDPSGQFVLNNHMPFGMAGDVPVPGDYNGDGVAEPAVYRPSTGQWFIGYGVLYPSWSN